MNTLKPSFAFRATHLARLRIPRTPLRRYATEPAPPHPPSTPPNPNQNRKEPSRVGTFYKSFSYPILKSFLGALFTYQLAYYLWMKLEVVEEKFERRSEIEGLQKELRDVVEERRVKTTEEVKKVGGKVKEGLERVETKAGEKMEAVKEEGKKRGWWPW